jgi:hypothetical protein
MNLRENPLIFATGGGGQNGAAGGDWGGVGAGGCRIFSESTIDQHRRRAHIRRLHASAITYRVRSPHCECVGTPLWTPTPRIEAFFSASWFSLAPEPAFCHGPDPFPCRFFLGADIWGPASRPHFPSRSGLQEKICVEMGRAPSKAGFGARDPQAADTIGFILGVWVPNASTSAHRVRWPPWLCAPVFSLQRQEGVMRPDRPNLGTTFAGFGVCAACVGAVSHTAG